MFFDWRFSSLAKKICLWVHKYLKGVVDHARKMAGGNNKKQPSTTGSRRDDRQEKVYAPSS